MKKNTNMENEIIEFLKEKEVVRIEKAILLLIAILVTIDLSLAIIEGKKATTQDNEINIYNEKE